MKITEFGIPLELGQESSECPFCKAVCFFSNPEKCCTHYVGVVQSFENGYPEDRVTFSLEHRDHGEA